MRFALIATGLAALAVAPFVVDVSTSRMEAGDFLSAVRCAALENVTGRGPDFPAMRRQLNAEARRQPVETAAQAIGEIDAITRWAAGVENADKAAILGAERVSACAGAAVAESAARAVTEGRG